MFSGAILRNSFLNNLVITRDRFLFIQIFSNKNNTGVHINIRMLLITKLLYAVNINDSG